MSTARELTVKDVRSIFISESGTRKVKVLPGDYEIPSPAASDRREFDRLMERLRPASDDTLDACFEVLDKYDASVARPQLLTSDRLSFWQAGEEPHSSTWYKLGVLRKLVEEFEHRRTSQAPSTSMVSEAEQDSFFQTPPLTSQQLARSLAETNREIKSLQFDMDLVQDRLKALESMR
jgi:uncharacterized coiled-coil protein SlyX